MTQYDTSTVPWLAYIVMWTLHTAVCLYVTSVRGNLLSTHQHRLLRFHYFSACVLFLTVNFQK